MRKVFAFYWFECEILWRFLVNWFMSKNIMTGLRDSRTRWKFKTFIFLHNEWALNCLEVKIAFKSFWKFFDFKTLTVQVLTVEKHLHLLSPTNSNSELACNVLCDLFKKYFKNINKMNIKIKSVFETQLSQKLILIE